MRSSPAVALIMAAGRSRRFGNDDKRLARLPNGQRLLAATVALANDNFSEVRLILREDDDPKTLSVPDDLAVIHAPHATQGLGASLADAFTALGQDILLEDHEAAAVLLADMPFIQASTLQALRREAAAHAIVRPSYNNRPGHPVFFGRRFWPVLERLQGDEGGRAVILHNITHYRELAVNDPGIHVDIDIREHVNG